MDYKIATDMNAASMVDFKALEIIRGDIWRYGTGFQIIAADTNYATVNFTTPATGFVFYSPTNISKTGFEATISLIEGGTYVSTGSSVLTGLNLNRSDTDTAPFGTVRFGLSPAGTTITGGVSFPEDLLPGASGGNSRLGGALSSNTPIALKPATNYTLKILARGGVVNFAASIDLIWNL